MENSLLSPKCLGCGRRRRRLRCALEKVERGGDQRNQCVFQEDGGVGRELSFSLSILFLHYWNVQSLCLSQVHTLGQQLNLEISKYTDDVCGQHSRRILECNSENNLGMYIGLLPLQIRKGGSGWSELICNKDLLISLEREAYSQSA